MKICQNCENEFNSEDWDCPKCQFYPQSESGFFSFAQNPKEADQGFNSELFEDLFKLEVTNFWFKVRNQIIIWALRKYFPNKKSFLEIGCGTGYVLSEVETQFPDMDISGSEFHINGLNFAKTRLKTAKLLQMDARNIPFVDGFDVIGAFDVLEHIKEDKKVLQQMYKALHPGGGIILTVPQHPFLWSAADEYAHHERRYTAGDLKSKLECAGFRVARTSSFVSFLFPAMVVSRLCQHSANKKYDPLKELNINRVLNWIFEHVLKFEAILIRMGVSIPFGGSLLVVAYKVDKNENTI